MRLLLIIVGAFAAIFCIEQRAQAEQNYPWCINKPDTPPQCLYTTLEQCWPIGSGKAGTVHPVRTPRHQNQPDARGAKACVIALPPMWLRH